MAMRLIPAMRALVAVNSTTTTTLRTLSTSSYLNSFESALANSSRSSPAIPSNQSTTDIPIPSRPPPPPTSTPSTDTALLHRLSRLIMDSGKLARAHSHLSLMLSTLHLTTSSPPLPILHRALLIASPSIRIVGRRKGTKSLPTPQSLTEDQRIRQAWLWIVEASDKRQGAEKQFGKRLAQEVLAVLGGQSEAIKKKEARHQQGVTGRANVGR